MEKEKLMLFELKAEDKKNADKHGVDSAREVRAILKKNLELLKTTPVYARLYTSYNDREFELDVQVIAFVDDEDFLVIGNPHYAYDDSVLEVVGETMDRIQWFSKKTMKKYTDGRHPELLATGAEFDVFQSLYFHKEDVTNKKMSFNLVKEDRL